MDRSLSDFIGSVENNPFGGNVYVIGRDFKHVLPIINDAARQKQLWLH